MARILFFVLLALAVYVAWKWMQRASVTRVSQPKPREMSAQAMVSCAHCGMHVPQSDALALDGRYFCSDEHRRLGASS
jgi:uncharacterized protein